MILPVVTLGYDTDGQLEETDAQTKRLAMMSPEIVVDLLASCAGTGQAPTAKSCKTLLRDCQCRVGPFDILCEKKSAQEREETTISLVSWLDSGAQRAIVKLDVSRSDIINEFADWTQQLPSCRQRLVCAIRVDDLRTREVGLLPALTEVIERLRPLVGCVQVDFAGTYSDVAPQILPELKGLRGREGSSTYVDLTFTQDEHGASPDPGDGVIWSPEEIGQLHLERGIDVQCRGKVDLAGDKTEALRISGSNSDSIEPVDAVGALLACVRTDREDGLIPTVVCDTTGVALGLVYSNSESIRASAEGGRGTYWSRSRGGLWRKGDTSGAWQELRGIALDCDSDALKFTVRQHGNPPAFCHFNRRTCWEDERGLGHLERTLAKRKEEAPAGSYTKRLFEDPTLLRNKLVEEAQELAEASTRRHVAEEAADVTYFMMVRCAAAGVGVEDVEKELNMRALKLKRRAGNAKAERIAEGDRILGKGRQTEATTLC